MNDYLDKAKELLNELITQFIAITNTCLIQNSVILGVCLISLHIFEKYKYRSFLRYKLNLVFDRLLTKTHNQNYNLKNSSPDEIIAIVDIWYVTRQHGIYNFDIKQLELLQYIKQLFDEGNLMYCWLIREIVNLLGIDIEFNPIKENARPYKNKNKTYDTYWLTHIFFLETDYLNRPLKENRFSLEILELLGVSGWLISSQNIDLAAEVAICLDLSKKAWRHEYKSLIAMIINGGNSLICYETKNINPDKLHTCSVIMVALAGFIENHQNYLKLDKNSDKA